MRIIAGALRGRTFDSPRGHKTHPMGDKVRGALFNSLGDIEGLRVFDAYGGSGALAFEAVSRGAIEALCIDNDSTAAETIRKNATTLGLSKQVHVTQANSVSWASTHPDEVFDIVLCDPPYDRVNVDALANLAGHTRQGGVFVVSLPPMVRLNLPDGFVLITTKSYGDATLSFYRKR